jgi:hypothetical protein
MVVQDRHDEIRSPTISLAWVFRGDINTEKFSILRVRNGDPCRALCYAGQDPFWLDRSTLNRVLRIKQLIVQKLTKRENYSAGSLIEILPGLAQRFYEHHRAFYSSRESNTRPWLLE